MTLAVEQPNSWEVNYPSLGLNLHCVLNTDEDTIRRNIEHSLTLGLKEVWPCKQQDTEVIICAGGPSLLDHIDEIRERQAQGAKVIALANVAHLLLAHGIRPNGHILLDSKPRNAEFIVNCETTLFISSQCDPKVFENALKTDNEIYLYHAVNNPEEFEVISNHYKEDPWLPIQGGSTITTRAIRLFTILGYKNFHIYGWDSCFMNDSHHAYEQPDADKHKSFKFEFEDRIFRVTPWMISQALEMPTFIKQFCMNINMQVHGEGLIAYIIEKACKLNVNIEEG